MLGFIATLVLGMSVGHKDLCDFPANSVLVSTDVNVNGVGKAQADAALRKVHRFYAPIFARAGVTLDIQNLWDNPTVNAQAYPEAGSRAVVQMFGGLLRHPYTNLSVVYTVACHEVGHFLGGQPRYNRGKDWASVEGQADYWAMECMRNVAPGRALSGAMQTARLLAALSGDTMPNVGTPDQTVVNKTYEGHPNAQCRWDTMWAAFRGLARPRCWFAP
jgi:hypothetical protein